MKYIHLMLFARVFPLFIGILLSFSGHSQGGTWIWVQGSNTNVSASPVYGTQGVAGSSNTPGGLYSAANWTDKQGNFWLFGGESSLGYSSDLWKYDPVGNTWTWVKGPGVLSQPGVYGTIGVAASSNNPGARGAGCPTWTDNNGDLWLFGGYGTDASGFTGALNDLWKYNIASNQWTWENGSSSTGATDVYGTLGVAASANTPGGRDLFTCSWVDQNGDLWLFGGSGAYNDMWSYNVSTNNWTWRSGPQGTNNPGSYGTMGVASSSNLPPPRSSYAHWKDDAGYFYMFGGYILQGDAAFDDVWKYDPVSNMWTWIAGNSFENYTGNFTTQCTNSGTKGPRAIWDNTSPQLSGCSNIFLTYGGENESGEADEDDLWLFDPQALQWKWLSGSSILNNAGNYGSLGVASSNNLPPARQGPMMWVDNNGVLWLFGGTLNFSTYNNDVWKFVPNPSCVQSSLSGGINTQLPNNSICKGDSIILTLSGVSKVQISPATSATIIDSLHIRLYPDTTTRFIITGNSICRNNDTTYVLLYVMKPGNFYYTLTDTQVCQGTSVDLTLFGLISPQITPSSLVSWLDTSQAQLTPDSTTSYLITSKSSVCRTSDTAKIKISVIEPAPYAIGIADSVICYGYDTIFTSGLSNIQITPSSYYFTWIDSFTASFYTYYSTTFNVTGNTSCGSPYSQVVNVHALEYSASYQLSKPNLCVGDTDLLSLYGISNLSITPSSFLHMIDSSHILLYPDTTTTYVVKGNSICGYYDSIAVTVRVSKPGVVNYSLSAPYSCSGYSDYLYLYGIHNPKISPVTYLYNTDSVDYYAYIYPSYPSSTYIITGQSVCGGYDTSTVTINVLANPNATLSKESICRGDSTLLKLSGLVNPIISPTVGNRWVDSADVMLHPDTTTTYTISGLNCYGSTSVYNITVHVLQKGKISYSVSNPNPCYGYGTYLYLYGVKSVQTNPSLSVYWTDSVDAYAYIYLYSSTTYTISGQSICGGNDTLQVAINISSPPSYSLSRPTICLGDSSTLTLTGIGNVAITPNTGYTWLDSADISFYPDTTTNYTITGTNCYGYTTIYNIKIEVIKPGGITYQVYNQSLCAGNSTYLYIYGAKNIQSNPYLNFYYLDTIDAYTYIYPTTTTTYQISGQSVCGGTDTTPVTITVIPAPTTTLAHSSVCTDDSTLLTITGLNNGKISPLKGVTAIDSTHFYLHPDTTTNYIITGNYCNGYTYYYSLSVEVINPKKLNYSIGAYTACSGYSDLLYIYGATSVQITPSSYLYWTDSTDAYTYLYPSSNTTYLVTGHNICGGTDSAFIPVKVESFPSYSLSNSSICAGDSGILTFTGLSGITISPKTGVSAIDSVSFILKPSYTTTYYITGVECGGYNTTYTITIQVAQPSSFSYNLSDSVVCSNGYTYISFTGVTNLSVSPYAYTYWSTNNQAYIDLYPTANTTYKVIATTVCGQVDTLLFNVYVINNSYYLLSSPTICRGDSAILSLIGFSSAQITPTTGVSWLNASKAYLHPDSTTSYVITGQTLCSGSYYQPISIVVTGPSVLISVDSSTFCSTTGAQICATPGYNKYVWNTGQKTSCISTSNNGLYDVTVTDPGNCTAQSNNINLTLPSLPSPTISAYPSSFCSGDSSTICCPNNFSTYKWNNGETTACIGAKQTGSYYVTVSDNNGCTGVSSQVSVTEYPTPVDSIISNISSFCNNDSGQICAIAGFSFYNWNVGGTGYCITVTKPGNYYVTITDKNGCTAESNHLAISSSVTKPDSIYAGKNSICGNDSTQICAPRGFSSYQWNVGNAGYCIEVKQAGNYYVLVTDSNGCKSESNQILISVYAAPVDSIFTDKSSFCSNDSATICSSPGFSVYDWNTGVGETCLQARQSGTYYVSVTDNNGCTAVSNQVALMVYPAPADSIFTDKSIFCANDSAQICSAANFTTFQWNSGDTTKCIAVKQAGNYYVTVTDNNGCTAQSNRVPIEVYPVPSVSIIVQGDTLSSFGAVTYQWIKNGDPIKNATGPFYIVNGRGSYTLEVTDTNGCTTTSNPVDVIAGINTLMKETVTLFPNPSSSSWQLTVGEELLGSYIEVYDEQGQVVFQSEIRSRESEISLNVAKGVYFLRIESSAVNLVRKLVKI